VKKKALVLAIYMACATPTIGTAKPLVTNFSALNLGEVKSHSNLGEPFKGIIPILFTSRKEAKQLKIRLAPKSIFAKLGAEKSADLKYLKFKVKTLRKKPVIVVSSSRPINSPILNFILEIESNKGVTYQDYTVMLDPPKSKTGSKEKSKTASKAATVAVATKTKKKKSRSKTYFSPTTSRKSISKYSVKSGDTLSKIAKNYRRKGISLKKMMKSIHRSNPKAFIRNDINKLKKGVVLHIPSKKQIKTNVKRKAKSNNKYKTGKVKKSAQQTNTLKMYKVKPGDTLSKITKKYVYKGVSFTKMMKAIFIANPKAFSKNKMTVLLAGAKLRIPTYVELVNKKAKHKNTAVLPAVKISPKTAKPSNTHQNISETSLSTQTQQAVKSQVDNQVADNQVVLNGKQPFNNHSSEDSIAQELIETLENSNATINSLQKRIRELRGNLSSLTNNYSDLTKMLTDDYFLLKIKEEMGQKNIQTLINEYKNYSQLTPEAKVRHTNLVKKSVDFVSKKENQSMNTFGSNHTPIAENSLSLKDLSYTMLALLLGMILIRYRKYIYSYSSISYDHPKYYTSAQDKASDPKEKQLNFSDALTKPSRNKVGDQNTNNIEDKFPWNENDNNVLPKKAPKEVQRRKKPSEISEESLQECELLIDELILELAKKTSKKSAQQSQAIDQITELENYLKSNINSNVKDKHSEIGFATQVDYSERNSDKVAMNSNKTNTPLIDILNDLKKTPPQSTSATTDET